ncbi:E3 ubiquitin-protein ligase rnf13, partial [Nowakowskiella sp. JEL0078]
MPDQETQTDRNRLRMTPSVPDASTPSGAGSSAPSAPQLTIDIPSSNNNNEPEVANLPETPRTTASTFDTDAVRSQLGGVVIEKLLNVGYIGIFLTFILIWGWVPCDQPLSLYLTIKSVVIAVKLPDKIIYQFPGEWQDSMLMRWVRLFWIIADYFAFCWFLAGNAFISNCNTCQRTNPNLYWLVFADCIFTWVVMLLSFALLVLANMVRRRQERYQAHMAALASMDPGVSRGLSNLELSRLRTFSFHSMSKPINTVAKVESLATKIPMTRLSRWRSDSNLFGARKIDNPLDETSVPYNRYPDFGNSQKHKITIISEDLLEKMEIEDHENVVTQHNLNEIKDISTEAGEEFTEDSCLSPNENRSIKDIESPRISTSTRSLSVVRAKSLDSVPMTPSASATSVASSSSKVNQIELPDKSHKTSSHETCVVCFEAYENGDRLRELACSHVFHKDCIDEWLRGDPETGAGGHRTCPLCVQEAIRPEDRDKEWLENNMDSDSEDFQELSPQTATSSQQESSTPRNQRERRRFFGRRSVSRSRQTSQPPSSTRGRTETERDAMERVLREGEMGVAADLNEEEDEQTRDRRRTWTFIRPSGSQGTPGTRRNQ